MAEEPENREKLPEVPPMPDLPQAPALKADLPPKPKPAAEESAKEYGRMGLAYTIPMALVVPIIALTLGGWWLDQRFHKSPAFTLVGAIVGTIVGFINLFRLASKLNE